MGIFKFLPICLLAVSCQESFRIESGAITSGGESFPPHAVVAFSAVSCPTGWTPYVKGRGRIMFGAGVGNLDAGSLALSNRVFDSIGGREYTSAIASDDDNVDSAIPGPSFVIGNPNSGSFSLTFDNYSPGFLESNMPPFIVKLLCEKLDSSMSSISAGEMIVAFGSSSCSGDWTYNASAGGRFIVGEGSGGSDPDGVILTSRSLDDEGGIPYTPPGIRYSTSPGISDGSSGSYFASNGTYDFATVANTTLFGPKTDSNLPPYVVVNYCHNSLAGVPTLPSHSVLAFNSSTCPAGWATFDEARGRALMGSGGMGNLDRDGLPLAPRTLGVTGGREYTTGIPASSSPGTTPTPGIPAGTAVDSYTSSCPDTFTNGNNSDGNIPPFVALKFCRKL